MANLLSVSSSYISALERGKKNLPHDFISKLSTIYSLSEIEVAKLRKAVELDTKSFVITPANDIEHQTVAMFARNIKSLPENKLKKIQDILGSEGD